MPDYRNFAEQLKLLAHPERLRLLNLLRMQPASVCHLEAMLEKPQPYVSQQLRLLRQAGMIVDERRGHNIYYHLNSAQIRHWLGAILGPATEDPLLAQLKETIPCQCPNCDGQLQVALTNQQANKEIIMSKAKVLFLCTGNSARSQMAEALLRHHAGDRFDVYSAGLEPKGINPYTTRVMNEMGIELTGHSSKDLGSYLGHVNFGYVITVCDHAEERCPAVFLSMGEHLHWRFTDPAAVAGTEEEKLAAFRTVRGQIDAAIQAWLAEEELSGGH